MPSIDGPNRQVLLSPGDILLTRNNSFFGRANSRYQRFRRRHELKAVCIPDGFIPTHAALALGLDDVIHSIKTGRSSNPTDRNTLASYREAAKALWAEKSFSLTGPNSAYALMLARRLFGYGVERAKFSIAFAGIDSKDLLLVRHPRTPAFGNIDFAVTLGHRGMFYLDMPYNPKIDIRPGGRNVFCSQLVYQVFVDCGLTLPQAPAHRVLPVDFLIWALSNNWQIYRGDEVLEHIQRSSARSPDEPDWAAIMVRNHRDLVESKKSSRKIEKMLADLSHFAAAMVKTIGRSSVPPTAIFEANLPAITQPVSATVYAAQFLQSIFLKRTSLPIADLPVANLAGSSWMINEDESAEAAAALADSQETVSCASLERTRVVLDDLENAVQATLATIRDCDGADQSVPAGGTARLAFILECIDWKQSSAEADKHIDKLMEMKHKCLGQLENALESSKAALSKISGEDAAGNTAAAEEYLRSSRDARFLCLINYTFSVAIDYAMTCALAGALAHGHQGTWEDFFANRPPSFLREVLELFHQSISNTRTPAYALWLSLQPDEDRQRNGDKQDAKE